MTGFSSYNGKENLLFSAASRWLWGHEASYTRIMGTAGSFPRKKCGLSLKLNTFLHLVPRSRTVELYLNTPYVFIAYYIY
jgi:hypothetical protein